MASNTSCLLGAAILLASCYCHLSGAVPTAEIMSLVSTGFGKTFEECKVEVGMTPEIMEEWHHFWSDTFELKHREIGCLIECMNHKQHLMGDDSRMHHENMDKFVKSFPDGEVLARRMVDMIHGCEKQHDAIADNCDRILVVAKCFKAECQRQGIAPTIDMLVAQLIDI